MTTLEGALIVIAGLGWALWISEAKHSARLVAMIQKATGHLRSATDVIKVLGAHIKLLRAQIDSEGEEWKGPKSPSS